MTDENIAAVLKGLQAAMRAEHEGYHFYMMAAANTDDERGQEAFKQLAADEFDHLNYLQAQYDNVVKTQNADPKLKLRNDRSIGGCTVGIGRPEGLQTAGSRCSQRNYRAVLPGSGRVGEFTLSNTGCTTRSVER